MTSPPEQLVQIQNNFKEMILMMPSTKIDQNVKLSCTTWPPQLKIEISLNDISLVTGQYTILCARTQVSIPWPSGWPSCYHLFFMSMVFRHVQIKKDKVTCPILHSDWRFYFAFFGIAKKSKPVQINSLIRT